VTAAWPLLSPLYTPVALVNAGTVFA